MKDINGLNKRISKLEYYSSLSLLEQKTKNLVIKNSTTGQDRFKNGIFVDNFESTFGSNLKDPEYFTSFDSAESSIIPRFDQFRIDLQYNTNENANTVLHSHTKTNDVVTLAYTGVPYLTQNTATRYRSCAEGYYNWTGTAFTVPLYDTFVDTRIPPQPVINPRPRPVPPPPVPQDDGGQPYIAPATPSFPRPQVGNMVWFAELDTAIFVPGDFVNGTLTYNSQLGYYTATAAVNDDQGTVTTVVNNNPTIVTQTGNTDPVIPPVSVIIDLPQPPPVEVTIIIDTNVDTSAGDNNTTDTIIDTSAGDNTESFNINNSQQWYDNYNYDSYWW